MIVNELIAVLKKVDGNMPVACSTGKARRDGSDARFFGIERSAGIHRILAVEVKRCTSYFTSSLAQCSGILV
jgi:hypothetical protein